MSGEGLSDLIPIGVVVGVVVSCVRVQHQIAAAGSCFTFHRATFLALIALTAVLADSRPAALLAMIALTAVLADFRPAALLALRAYTTVLAD